MRVSNLVTRISLYTDKLTLAIVLKLKIFNHLNLNNINPTTCYTYINTDKRFVDILIKPFNPYVKNIGLLEFKYINRDEKANKKTVEKLKLDAIEQLKRYENDTLVTKHTKEGLEVKKVVLIFHGWEMLVCEEV